MLHSNLLLLLLTLPVCLAGWTQMPGKAVDIAVRANELWSIDPDMNVYRFENSNWVKQKGWAMRVAPSPDGWCWAANALDELWRYTPGGPEWTKMPGTLVQISANSKDSAIGVDRYDNVWQWNGQWRKLPVSGTWASIGLDGERWLVNREGLVYRAEDGNDRWTLTDMTACYVSVTDKKNVLITKSDGEIYHWNGEEWRRVVGTPGQAVLAVMNSSSIYAINSDNEIYKAANEESMYVDEVLTVIGEPTEIRVEYSDE